MVRHSRRALLRSLPASLSRRQGPTPRIARWGIDRSAWLSRDPDLRAPRALEPALDLTPFPRAPHFLGGPLLRPLERHVLTVEGMIDRVRGREDLDEIEGSNEAPGRPVASAFASTSSRPSPYFAFIRRAVSSCAGVMSTPTTRRAPTRFSQAATYAVPHPSSTMSLPRTSGRTLTWLSGVFHTPQEISCSF